jgi:hypothetical protein
MNKRRIIPVLIVAFFASSCDDYLDVIPDNLYTIDKSFNLRMEAEKFLFTCYSYMPRQASAAQNPALTGADEIIVSTYYRDTSAPTGWYIGRGMNNVTNPYNDYWRGTNNAQNLYRGIRDCNIFLENIGRVPDMEDFEKDRWIAEVKFLKAYYHYYLVRLYGPIPVKDVNVEVEAGTEEVKVYRNTLDECFDYIVKTLDEVIESGYLPKFIENRAMEMGRLTSTIALALKAEVLVTAASPLFNGNTDYSGFVDGRGVEIFNPNKTEEEKRLRWVKAAEACKAAIDSCHAIGHVLYEYTLTEYQGISDDTRAKLTIRNAMTEKWNTEIVWANTQSWMENTQDQAIPRGLEADKLVNTLYCSNFAVPLKVAAQFYTRNGVPITEDRTWDYENRFNIRTATAAEGSLIREGYKSAEFNFDREIRYYADLAFDGGVWFGQGKTTEATAIYVQCKAGQIAAPQVENSFNETCIWPKKIVHPKTVVGSQSGITRIIYPYPLIRLANLYLLYAEALNEAEGPNGVHSDDLFFYIDKVRERAQLNGVKESWTDFSTYPTKFTNQRGMREIIQQERLIELAFESQRFWDLRRWKTASQELTKPFTGWNRNYNEPEDFYKEMYIATPNFTARDYFWPISEDEISRDGNIVQNYGW